MSDANGREPERMVAALGALSTQPRPSAAVIPGLLDGLDRIHDFTEQWLDDELEPRRLALV